MILGLLKFVCKVTGVASCLERPVRLLQEEMHNIIKKEIRKKLKTIIFTMMIWLSWTTLLMTGCVFALLALASYLNEILYSNYKGFLLVAAGCVLLDLLVLLVINLRSKHRKG